MRKEPVHFFSFFHILIVFLREEIITKRNNEKYIIQNDIRCGF